jgi:ubiquinol-cytochrome c reductase cytochrome b subunit
LVIQRIFEGLDNRLGAATFARKSLRKVFPDHWSFMLGEIALYCFLILVLTGTFLTFFFVPSGREVVYQGPYAPLRGQEMSAAFESVLHLSLEVRAGLVMRQIHHWAAVVMVAAVVLHLLRVFFTGAFRRPRDLNWMLGVTLLLLAIGAGFTGYSLPDDLLSGTGLRIAYSVVLSIPLVGPWIASLFFSGEFPSPEIIGRLHAIHIFIVPALIAVVLTGHLGLVWHQKHTEFRAPGRTERTITGSRLWPNYAMKSAGLAFMTFAVLALLGGLFQINPVWLYGPFDPSVVSSPAQPDWYVGWLDGALRLFPALDIQVFGRLIPEVFWPGVVMPAIFFGTMYAWPFIERRLTGDREAHNLLDRPRDAPMRSGVGAGVLTFAAILTLEGSNDVIGPFIGVAAEDITRFFQVLVLPLPLVVGYMTYRFCRSLRDRDLHPILRPKRVRLRRTARGGFSEEGP